MLVGLGSGQDQRQDQRQDARYANDDGNSAESGDAGKGSFFACAVPYSVDGGLCGGSLGSQAGCGHGRLVGCIAPATSHIDMHVVGRNGP